MRGEARRTEGLKRKSRQRDASRNRIEPIRRNQASVAAATRIFVTCICKRQNKSMPQMKSNRSKTTISHLLIVQCRCCCCCSCLTAGCVRPSSSFPLMVEPPPTTPPAHGLMETNKMPTRFHFLSDKGTELEAETAF